MKNWFLNSALLQFKQEFSYATLSESEAFERFANYCIISDTIKDELDGESIESLSVGGSDDLGIDGVALLVNNQLITSVDDLESIPSYFDARFVFVQSKISDKFDLGASLKFMNGVRRWLESSAPDWDSDKLAEAWLLKKGFEEHASRLVGDKYPECHIHYVTTGNWRDPKPIVEAAERFIEDIQRSGIFKVVEFHPWDAQGLREIHQEVTNRIDATLHMEHSTDVPVKDNTESVYQAWVGVIRCKELLRFVSDEDGEMRSNLFDSNVRDYQGDENKVNSDIISTLRDSDDKRSQFVLLNNGVTIVARGVRPAGSFTYHVTGYQIVNGCQTTHVLWNNQEVLTDDMYVPVKLIATDDIDLMNSIVMKTNSQTQIVDENFAALSPYHRELETFYNVTGPQYLPRIYYERRSRQYANRGISRNHCVSMAGQIKSYVGMFGEKPHAANHYFGQILKQDHLKVPGLFSGNDRLIEHFVSGYAMVTLNGLFSRGIAPSRFRKFYPYHILMLFRILNEPSEGKGGEKCSKLLEVLSDPNLARKAFADTYDILDDALRLYPNGRDRGGNPAGHLIDFTAHIRRLARERRSAISMDDSDSEEVLFGVHRRRGNVISTTDVDAYIQTDDGERFVANGYTLTRGQSVEFTVAPASRGTLQRAVDLERLQ